jgi:hypothetical protein
MSEIFRICLAVIATAVVVIALLFGAGALHLPTTGQNPQPEISSAADTTGKTANDTQVTYTFVQEGSEGTFIPNALGNYTLTIRNVTPFTFYMSDRPVRDAGFVPMKTFLETFAWGKENPPNAAILIPGAKEHEDTLMVTLTNPVYVSDKQMLTYDARILKSYTGKGLKHIVALNDPVIPTAFGRVTVIIDSCPDFSFYCYTCKQNPAMLCRYFMGGCGWVRVGTCWQGLKGCQPCHPQQIMDECNNKFLDCRQTTCEGWTAGCMFCEPGIPT